MDRLHTCYAPVRRSPPMYCYTALPLDLHVLGLSLAFILSQDQTLRCNKKIIFLVQNTLNLLYCLTGTLSTMHNSQCIMHNDFASLFPWVLFVLACTTSCWLTIFQRPLCFHRENHCLSRKRVQNYCFFLNWPNLTHFFLNFLRNSLILNRRFFRAFFRNFSEKLENINCHVIEHVIFRCTFLGGGLH